MRSTRPNTLLRGTSTAAFNESTSPLICHQHHHVGVAALQITQHLFLYLWNKPSAPDDRKLSVFSGQKKYFFTSASSFSLRGARVHFSVSMPHLSLSNIWLLAETFLCLSWVDSKNYITGLLTVSFPVCVCECVLLNFIPKKLHTHTHTQGALFIFKKEM